MRALQSVLQQVSVEPRSMAYAKVGARVCGGGVCHPACELLHPDYQPGRGLGRLATDVLAAVRVDLRGEQL